MKIVIEVDEADVKMATEEIVCHLWDYQKNDAIDRIMEAVKAAYEIGPVV